MALDRYVLRVLASPWLPGRRVASGGFAGGILRRRVCEAHFRIVACAVFYFAIRNKYSLVVWSGDLRMPVPVVNSIGLATDAETRNLSVL